MKAFEFQTQMPADGILNVPAHITAQIPDDDRVRVVLVVGEPTDDEAWGSLTAERFPSGHAPGDAVYDNV